MHTSVHVDKADHQHTNRLADRLLDDSAELAGTLPTAEAERLSLEEGLQLALEAHLAGETAAQRAAAQYGASCWLMMHCVVSAGCRRSSPLPGLGFRVWGASPHALHTSSWSMSNNTSHGPQTHVACA